MLNKYFKLFVVLNCLVGFYACNKTPVIDISKQEVVYWNVTGVEEMKGGANTKAMIESSNKGNNSLQLACTPISDGGWGKSIGIWADYSVLDGSGTVDKIYTDIFKGTSLIYKNKSNGNPNSYWNYDGEDLYWVMGGIYKFRSYYPQREIEEFIMPNSNATTFVVDYNAAYLQEDLLLAYNTIDTRIPNITNSPVPLKFKHVMTALRFKFKFQDGYYDEDAITSCWLENFGNDDKKWLSSVGLLVYGSNQMGKEEQIEWSLSHKPLAGHPVCYWKHNGDGIVFKNVNGETPIEAIAYTDTDNAQEGVLFTKNDGYIILIPQKNYGSLRLCFTTKYGGETEYSVMIPKDTGTPEDGTKDEFLQGYRYTYTVSISKTNLNVNVVVENWNDLNSSFQIDF